MDILYGYFYWVVTIYSKKYGYFSPNLGEEKKLSNPFPANPMAIKHEGWGKALMSRPLRKLIINYFTIYFLLSIFLV